LKLEEVAEDSVSGGEDTKSEDADPIQTEQTATKQEAGEAMEPETFAPPKAKKVLSARERKAQRCMGCWRLDKSLNCQANHLKQEKRALREENESILALARSLTANWNDGNRKEAGVVLAHIVGSGPEAAQTVHAIARMLKKVRRSRILWWLGIVKCL
jgi:hypothetical protein